MIKHVVSNENSREAVSDGGRRCLCFECVHKTKTLPEGWLVRRTQTRARERIRVGTNPLKSTDATLSIHVSE